MIVPPAPTVIEIGLNATGGAARNRATQATMSINVWLTARLSVIDQRRCVQRSAANVICMQIAVCGRSPSEPEHHPPTRHWYYPHSAASGNLEQTNKSVDGLRSDGLDHAPQDARSQRTAALGHGRGALSLLAQGRTNTQVARGMLALGKLS